MKERTLKVWVYFAICFVVLLLLGLFILVIAQIVKVKNLQRQKEFLESKLNTLLQDEAYYDDANKYVTSSEFIEGYAREVLGLGKEGEENYN